MPERSKAWVYRRIDADTLGTMLTAEGFDNRVVRAPGVDTWFKITLGDMDFMMVLYDGGGDAGDSLLLFAGMRGPEAVTPGVVNAWNAAERYGRAYAASDGTAVLEQGLDLAGGVTPAAIRRYVHTFARTAGRFAVVVGVR